MLRIQLDILRANHEVSGNSLYSLFKSLSIIYSNLNHAVIRSNIIAKLIILMQATNAVSERSFSPSREIYTYLLPTMTKIRLNSAIILNTYKERTDELNLIDMANGFMRGSEFLQYIWKICVE